MKATVRDDIIGLDCYVEAEFKYRKYLELIIDCGGYCFLEQFERLLKDEGGSYLAKKMEESNLIKLESFNKYKYIRLSSNALKYLYYRDDENDYSEIPKNKIPVRNLSSTPSNKVLFTSAMLFELSQISKSNHWLLKSKQKEKLELELIKNNDNLIKEKIEALNKLKTEYNTNQSIIKFITENQLELQIEEIKNISESLDQDITERKREIEDNKMQIFKSKKISYLERLYENTDKIKSENNNLIKSIENINKKISSLKKQIQIIEGEIIELQNETDMSKKRAEIIIPEMIQLRDISKIVCSLKQSYLQFVIFSVKDEGGNYSKLIKNILILLSENNVTINNIRIFFISPFNENKDIKKIEYFIKQDYRYERINFEFKHIILPEIKKYLDEVSNTVSFIKESNIEDYIKLKDKLNTKEKMITKHGFIVKDRFPIKK